MKKALAGFANASSFAAPKEEFFPNKFYIDGVQMQPRPKFSSMDFDRVWTLSTPGGSQKPRRQPSLLFSDRGRRFRRDYHYQCNPARPTNPLPAAGTSDR